MNHNFLVLLLLILVISFQEPVYAQHQETRNVGLFTAVSFGVSGKLYLRQGNTHKVVLEGDEDALEKIETKVSGSKLIVQVKESWWEWFSSNRVKNVTVYVTVEKIDGLYVSGSGDVIGENAIHTNDLDLKVSGSGNLSLDITTAKDLNTTVSGSGNISLKGACDRFTSHISGSGNIELALDVAGNASFGMSGSGKLSATGKAQHVKTSITGSGRMNCSDFETRTCDVRITGSGDVEIGVKEALDANISGSGSVRYRGNPSKVNSHSSGSGKVRKI